MCRTQAHANPLTPTTDRILTYQHSGTVVDLCQQLAP